MAQRWSGGDQPSRNADVFRRMVLTGSRRRRWEVPLWIVVIAASMFLMGFLVGNAQAAPSKCNRVYQVEYIQVGPRGFERLVPKHPVMAQYAKCLREVQPVGAPDRP